MMMNYVCVGLETSPVGRRPAANVSSSRQVRYVPPQTTNKYNNKNNTITTTFGPLCLPMANTTHEVLHGHNQQQRPKQAKHQWNPSLRNEDTSLISLPQEQCTY